MITLIAHSNYTYIYFPLLSILLCYIAICWDWIIKSYKYMDNVSSISEMYITKPSQPAYINTAHLNPLRTDVWCRRQAKAFQLFSTIFKIQIFINRFEFSMKNASKRVQTSLVLVQWFLR